MSFAKNMKNVSRRRPLKNDGVAREVPIGDLFKPPLSPALQHDADEPKYFDLTGTTVNPTSSGTLALATAITQGAGVSSREGDAVNLRAVDFRAYMFTGSTSGVDALRIVIFQWNQDTAVGTPAAADLLSAPLLGTAAAPVAHYNFSNARQHKISVLFDELVALTDSADGGVAVAFRKQLPIKSQIQFNAGTTTGAGHLYLALFTTNAGGAATTNMQYSLRTMFSDV